MSEIIQINKKHFDDLVEAIFEVTECDYIKKTDESFKKKIDLLRATVNCLEDLINDSQE